MIRHIINLERRVVDFLESSRIPLVYFILTFLFVINLRNFIELFSDRGDISFLLFLHYCLFYIALAMSLVALFSILTKTGVVKTAKVVLPSFIILVLAPIADLILNLGEGFDIAYLRPALHDNLLLRFFSFFGDFPGRGITPGMRIEIAVVLFASLGYFYLKGAGLIKGLFNTFLTYALIFSYCASPFLIKGMLTLTGFEYQYSNLLIINFYFLIIFLMGLLIAYLSNKDYFKLIIKDIRPCRLIHFELMFPIGLIIALVTVSPDKFVIADNAVFHLIFIPISIAFGWLYSVIMNNIEDYEIDRISNRARPLARSQISLEAYRKLSWVCLAASLFYAAAVGFTAFFIILLFIGNYFLYSMPPFRLKRVPLLSKFVISLNSLIFVMLGFAFMTGTLYGFPKPLIALFLIGFTAGINFIDIKDYEGDKRAGIKTLPVILGLKRAKFFIGLCFMAIYSSSFFLLKDIYLAIPFFILGLTQFFLINRKDYSERVVFVIYLLSVVLFVCLYLFTPY